MQTVDCDLLYYAALSVQVPNLCTETTVHD